MSILSIIPPLAVFIVGLMTHRIRLALVIGIAIGGLMGANFDLFHTLPLIWNHFLHALEISPKEGLTSLLNDHVFILLCLFFFGVMIQIICQSNAAEAFQRYSRRLVSDKRSAETSCISLSCILCIDDYLSSLVVGAVMRPLTDRFHVARAKLAYLCNSLSAPITSITPISSWAAAILGILMEVGIHETAGSETMIIGNPYNIYLHMIPYTLYSITLITAVFFLVRSRVSYGLMAIREQEADRNALSKTEDEIEHPEVSIWDFSIPIASLIFGIILSLLYTGGFFTGEASFFDALINAKVSRSLLIATLFSTLLSLSYYLAKGTFSFKDLPCIFKKGGALMFPAILILALTWTLNGLMKEELHTGEYVGSLLGESIPLALIPMIIFWLASGVCLLISSAWGTMALFFTLVPPMLITISGAETPLRAEELPLLLPTLGAVLSGAVFGNHVSLFSDISVMAACSTHCDLLDHIKTKFGYAVPVFISSSIGFLLAGLFPNMGAITPAIASIALTITMMRLLSRRTSDATVPAC